ADEVEAAPGDIGATRLGAVEGAEFGESGVERGRRGVLRSDRGACEERGGDEGNKSDEPARHGLLSSLSTLAATLSARRTRREAQKLGRVCLRRAGHAARNGSADRSGKGEWSQWSQSPWERRRRRPSDRLTPSGPPGAAPFSRMRRPPFS